MFVALHVCACMCVVFLNYRVGFVAGEFVSPNFLPVQDQALVHHVDSLCRRLSCSPTLLQTADVVLSETHFVSKQLQPLQGKQ